MADQKGTAKELVTLWQTTKRDDMLTGDLDVELMENLVKAARVGGKPKIKFLGFKGVARNGKNVLNILAEPADAYVKPGTAEKSADKPKSSW